MKEILEIIRSFDKAVMEGKQTALLTVVHVEGSSYRRPGARMLVTEDGLLTGAISGGCLEGDALRKALLVMQQQKPMLITYDTTDEDDEKLGTGLGCNGIIQVLIEPVGTDNALNPVLLLKKLVAERRDTVLITLFSLQNKKKEQPGTCLLLETGHLPIGSLSNLEGPLYAILKKEAERALAEKKSLFTNHSTPSGEFIAFIEYREPQVSLIIIGAGNDARPLAAMADIIGWQVTIIDGRANYAGTERFPQACSIRVTKPENALKGMVIDSQTVFLLMTHNYAYDKAMLGQLLLLPSGYIGMLGPLKKRESMLEELQQEGILAANAEYSNLYSPTGLDIGAETSEEIALSILAEIKAVLAGRTGKSLRDREIAIHSRENTLIENQQLYFNA